MEREFICLKEASQLLGVNEKTMKKVLLNNSDKISFSKVGNKILINKQKLLDVINNNC